MLVIERHVKAPTDKVWKALTDHGQLKLWSPFWPDFKAEVGFQTEFMLGPDDHQYRHLVEVIEAERNKILAFTWRYDGYTGNSTVRFELTAEAGGTHLVLTHTITESFPAGNPAFDAKNFASGWNYTADALQKFVESINNHKEKPDA